MGTVKVKYYYLYADINSKNLFIWLIAKRNVLRTASGVCEFCDEWEQPEDYCSAPCYGCAADNAKIQLDLLDEIIERASKNFINKYY